MMFYLETRYPELSLVEESTYRESQPKLGYLCTLISWAKSDPVIIYYFSSIHFISFHFSPQWFILLNKN